MEGYTDSSYRQLIKLVAPSTIVYTEFTSADGLKYGSKNSFKKIEFNEIERPLIAQIFGKLPKHFAECAKVLEDMGVDGIDINMGCPSGKVVASCHGSALFRHPELAQEIVFETQKATNLDVSVKMRLGFDCYTEESLLAFAKGLEAAGCKHLAVHGRTTKQQYTGTADFDPIYNVKKALNISVVGNGDIKTVADVERKIGNLDGVMIGRATYGNPWFMAEVEAHFQGTEYTPPKTLSDKLPMIIKQCELACEFKGERVGMMEMRKHLANYIYGIPNAAKYRFELVRVETMQQAIDALNRIIEETTSIAEIDI
jgi:nifR3 family TIM-barrel protein